MNNLAVEHIECVSYIVTMNACMIKSGKAELAAKVAAELLERATKFSNEAKVKPETVKAPLDLARGNHTKAIDNNCANVSIGTVTGARHSQRIRPLVLSNLLRLNSGARDEVTDLNEKAPNTRVHCRLWLVRLREGERARS